MADPDSSAEVVGWVALEIDYIEDFPAPMAGIYAGAMAVTDRGFPGVGHGSSLILPGLDDQIIKSHSTRVLFEDRLYPNSTHKMSSYKRPYLGLYHA